MKKVLALLSILMITNAWANEVVWTDVSTAEEFYNAMTTADADGNYTANVRITADIDLSQLADKNPGSLYLFGDLVFKGKLTGLNINGDNFSLKNNSQRLLLLSSENAEFSEFFIDNCVFYNPYSDHKKLMGLSLLSRSSSGSVYRAITVRNSKIHCEASIDLSAKSATGDIASLIAYSTNDTVQECNVESTCEFLGTRENGLFVSEPETAHSGAFAATATGSQFIKCHNAAKITSIHEYAGGIVGTADNCKIEACLNTGDVVANKWDAGIVAYAKNTEITKCVNLGAIKDEVVGISFDHKAGIVAELDEGSSVSYCINTGTIYLFRNQYGGIYGEKHDNTVIGDGNYYNYKLVSNDGTEYNQACERPTGLMTGRYAYENGFYQDLDYPYTLTPYPIPCPLAGIVYKDILCSGLIKFSNTYSSEKKHTSEVNVFGLCDVCGMVCSEPASEITIKYGEELPTLSYAVKYGVDFSNSTISLDDDLDMRSVYHFVPIGVFPNRPFKGTFNGNNHRILNLKIDRKDGKETGLFGCVGGTTTIAGVVIDSSCEISGCGYGTAGIVGCLALPSEDSTDDKLDFKMMLCGNEANIKGNINAAGLVGGFYNAENNSKENCSILISNCYNAGDITGERESAAFIGYGIHSVNVVNCFNSGTITGYDEGHSLVRCKSYNTEDTYCLDLYNKEGLAQDVAQTTTSELDFVSGKLCYKMKNLLNNFGQNLGSDKHPVFSEAGIIYGRIMTSNYDAVCLPFAIYSDEFVQLYSITGFDYSKGQIKITPVESVAANTPCVFRNKDTEIPAVVFSAENEKVIVETESPVINLGEDGITMHGTYTGAQQQSVFYINQDKFWLAEEPVDILPFNAWISGISASEAQSFTLVVDGVATGDVNGDGEVDVTDINATINVIMGKTTSEYYNGRADVNGDGEIDIVDINTIINLILSN